MKNDMDLKINVALQQKKNIQEVIDKSVHKHLNEYLVSIILIFAEHSGDDDFDCRVFFL